MFVKFIEPEALHLTKMTLELVVDTIEHNIKKESDSVKEARAMGEEHFNEARVQINRLKTDLKFTEDGLFIPDELLPYFAMTFDKGISLVEREAGLSEEELMLLRLLAVTVRRSVVLSAVESVKEQMGEPA